MNVKKDPLIIALLFLSVGFSQQLKTNEVVTERHDNGLKKLLLVFEGTGVNEALVGKYGFYDDGLNEFVELYRNNKKHGKSLYWHNNGNQKGELNYKDGKLYGTQKEWRSNGKLHFISTYKDGKKNGLETNYFFDGQKQNEGKYKDGNQAGLWSGWYNNGQLHFTSTYKDGNQDGLYTEWYSHRWKHGEGNYKDGKQEGLWTWWYKDGNIDKEEKYDSGYKIEETIYTYFKSGKKESKGSLTEGKRNGLFT